MHPDFHYLDIKLQKATYEAALGIVLVHLSSTKIGDKKVEEILIKIDPGKELNAHLHMHGGEICTPLTQGIVILGDARKKKNGEYSMQKGKVVVDWEKPKKLIPGKAFRMAEGKAHYFRALPESPLFFLVFLPATHLGVDRKFAVHPPKV